MKYTIDLPEDFITDGKVFVTNQSGDTVQVDIRSEKSNDHTKTRPDRTSQLPDMRTRTVI